MASIKDTTKLIAAFCSFSNASKNGGEGGGSNFDFGGLGYEPIYYRKSAPTSRRNTFSLKKVARSAQKAANENTAR